MAESPPPALSPVLPDATDSSSTGEETVPKPAAAAEAAADEVAVATNTDGATSKALRMRGTRRLGPVIGYSLRGSSAHVPSQPRAAGMRALRARRRTAVTREPPTCARMRTTSGWADK